MTKHPLNYRGRILEIEGLRGIAVLLVTIHHFWPSVGSLARYAHIAHLGWVGVDLFFVISGFLIGGILLDTKQDPDYYRSFYVRRFLRIFPLYYMLLLALFLCVPLTQMYLHKVSYSDTEFLKESGSPLWYFMYLGNIREAITGVEPAYFLAPLWSLSIEEQFYISFPLFVRCLNRRQLKKLLIFFIISAPLLRLVMYCVFPGNERIQYLATFCRWDNISMGVLLAVFVRTPGAEQVNKNRVLVVTAGLIMLSVLSFRFGWLDRMHFPCRVFGYTLTSLTFSSVLLATLCGRKRAWTGVLRIRPLCYIGGICYGMYLLQRPSEIAITKGLSALHIPYDPGSALLILIKGLVALCVASLSWKILEQPINNLKTVFLTKHHPMYSNAPWQSVETPTFQENPPLTATRRDWARSADRRRWM